MRTIKTLFLAIALSLAGAVQAGMVTVFSDANMWFPAPPPGNAQLANNLFNLAGGPNATVLMSTQAVSVVADGLHGYYAGLGGITYSRSGAAVDAGLLAGVDLLILDIGFGSASPYDAGELAAIAAFRGAGGSVALIAESDGAADIASYNAILTAIGSAMQFLNDPRCCGGFHNADTILGVPLTAGVGAFVLAAANNIFGGTAAIMDDGYTVVAFEQQVTEPGSLALLGLGLLGFVFGRRRMLT